MRLPSGRGPSVGGSGGSLRTALLVAALLILPATRAHAILYFVDRNNTACSDAGNGTLSAPYCTIGAAVAHAGPGVTVYVKSGVYRERIVIPASGAQDAPFVIEAATAQGPVVIDGADDFASLARWASYVGDVWLASSVTVAPKQVFVDGARLAASTASPDLLPPASFRFVTGAGLYVNVGGGSPGARQTFVGARTNAFRVTGRSWVEIRNFDVTRCDDKGIYVLTGSRFVTIFSSRVSLCASNGIGITASTDVTIDSNRCWENGDHGISLVSGVTRSLVRANESFRNARLNVRAATGIYLFSSPDNRIEGNRAHHNQDSGFEFADTSHRNVSIQNLSWSNGDHGFDHVRCTGSVHVGDVAWGNFKDGFSIEGNATGTSLFDCIATENGLTTAEYDLYVDPNSMSGFASNDNLFWSPAPRIKVNGVLYSSLAAYSAATGLDGRSIEADPRFTDTAAGNFELRSGSPAIDSGNSSVAFWPEADMAGRARVDVLLVANTGLGAVPYADRGALEYSPPSLPPTLIAPVTATVAEGAALTITVQASDPWGQPIIYLAAELSGLPAENDAVFTPAANLSSGKLVWHPTYSDSGTYRVTFIASSPATTTATTTIHVTNTDRAPVITPTPASIEVRAGSLVRVDIAVSDPDGDAIQSLAADLSRLPAGNNATFTANPTLTGGTLLWTTTSNDDHKNVRVTFTARNARTSSIDVSIKIRARAADGAVAAVAPLEFALAGPFPNPARGVASWSVAMPGSGRVEWSIVDPQGRVVWNESRDLEAGLQALTWSGVGRQGARVPPGVYFARVRSPFESGVRTQRFLYLR
jgi:parallel beta-helix repeat protein